MDIVNTDPPSRPFGRSNIYNLVQYTCEYPEYLEIIKNILDHYPDEIDKQDRGGWTALMYACRNSDTVSTLETVELLLKYNPDLYLHDYSNTWNALNSIFLYITTGYYKEIIRLLIDHGLDINRPDKNGRHIILIMTSRNHDAIEYLLETTNIDLYYKDQNNKYVYEYLLSTNNKRIINLTKSLMDNSLDVKSALD